MRDPWRDSFSRLFHASVSKYLAGCSRANELVDATDRAFLAGIGHSSREFFDFVEDFAKGGEPTMETTLRIAEVRRDYFLNEQKGIPSQVHLEMDTLPSKDDEVDGIGWLPRLLPKAEAKLRGEMPEDLMYGCGGDRKFFRVNGIDPAAFLREVWKARGDHAAVISWVKTNRRVEGQVR